MPDFTPYSIKNKGKAAKYVAVIYTSSIHYILALRVRLPGGVRENFSFLKRNVPFSESNLIREYFLFSPPFYVSLKSKLLLRWQMYNIAGVVSLEMAGRSVH